MLIPYKREITQDVYNRAQGNNGFITNEDEEVVFSQAERWGYGVYLPRVFEENGKYWVSFEMGSSCD